MAVSTTNHDDNDITERLIDGGTRAIEEVPTPLAHTRTIAEVVTVSVLRNLADEIDKADEDDVIWPDAGDLRILAGEIEAGAVQP